MNEEKSRRYQRLRRRASVAAAALSGAVLLTLVLSGGGHALREIATRLSGTDPSAPSTVAIFAVALILLHELAVLPVTVFRGFVLERRYGLSSEGLPAWGGDQLKGLAVALLLGLAGAQVVYAAMGWWPRWWWLASGLIFVAASALLVKLAPILLLPLFYRVGPLQREGLQRRLLALSERAGVPVLGVYVWGLGDKTRRANAALVGSGMTRRILLSDTLLADFTDDEIEIVLAHELAHHRHGDIPKGLVLESAVMLAGFAAAAGALAALWQPLELLSPRDVAGLPLLVLAGSLVSFAAVPVLNARSRAIERRADQYALRLTGTPVPFISAMRRLRDLNLAEERPSRATVWLFHTHPPIEERVEIAQSFRV